MEDVLVPIGVVAILFVALPWLVMHYVTRWKTAATLTTGDEALLDELYRIARRLEDRVVTVERLVAADHPEFKPTRAIAERAEFDTLRDDDFAPMDRILAERTAK